MLSTSSDDEGALSDLVGGLVAQRPARSQHYLGLSRAAFDDTGSSALIQSDLTVLGLFERSAGAAAPQSLGEGSALSYDELPRAVTVQRAGAAQAFGFDLVSWPAGSTTW